MSFAKNGDILNSTTLAAERGQRTATIGGSDSQNTGVTTSLASWFFSVARVMLRAVSHHLDIASDMSILIVGLAVMWPLVGLYLLLWIGGSNARQEK